MTYMIVNESERIENNSVAIGYKYTTDKKLEMLSAQIQANKIYTINHGHIYHDDKPYLPKGMKWKNGQDTLHPNGTQ